MMFSINYANIKSIDTADGEGVRVALYESGCCFRCEECHNSIAWDYNYGNKFTNETINYIISLLKPNYISGFSILGGEPLDPKNRNDTFEIISEISKTLRKDQSIWLWTAYKWEDLIKFVPLEILNKIKVIVDGPFILSERNISLKFRGSTNQRVINVKKSLKENKIIKYLD